MNIFALINLTSTWISCDNRGRGHNYITDVGGAAKI